MQANIKNILVDFGGVLIDLNRESCVRAFKELGLDNIEELIDPYHQQGFFSDLEKGKITPAMFRNEVRRCAGKEMEDSRIDAAWNSFLAGIPLYRLEALLMLRRHYKVYLLSNTNEIHWKWACGNSFIYKQFRVEDYFDKIYLSYQLHQVKPDREIFRTVLSDAGIRAAETFFLDDAKENCRVAQTLGINTYTPSPGEDWRHLFK